MTSESATLRSPCRVRRNLPTGNVHICMARDPDGRKLRNVNVDPRSAFGVLGCACQGIVIYKWTVGLLLIIRLSVMMDLLWCMINGCFPQTSGSVCRHRFCFKHCQPSRPDPRIFFILPGSHASSNWEPFSGRKCKPFLISSVSHCSDSRALPDS